MNDDAIQRRLSELGIELPDPPRAVAAYVPVRIAGRRGLRGRPGADGRREVMHPGRLGDPDSA